MPNEVSISVIADEKSSATQLSQRETEFAKGSDRVRVGNAISDENGRSHCLESYAALQQMPERSCQSNFAFGGVGR